MTTIIILFEDAIRMNPCAPASRNQVDNEMKIWLRNSGDRQGGRKSRQLKKQLLEAAEEIENFERMQNDS